MQLYGLRWSSAVVLFWSIFPIWNPLWGAEASSALQPLEARVFVQLLESAHFDRTRVSPARYSEIVAGFMSELDGQRMFFLNSDEQRLTKKIGRTLYQEVALSSNVDSSVEIFEVYRDRLNARLKWIQSELTGAVNLKSEEAAVDLRYAAKAWPLDSVSADELWRRRLKSELLIELINGQTLEKAKAAVAGRYKRLGAAADAISKTDLAELLLVCIAHLYDADSTYFGAETFADFGRSQSAAGLGFEIAANSGRYFVKSVEAGTAAEKTGRIEIGDQLISIGRENEPFVELVGLSLRKIQMLRGPPGQQVQVLVEHACRPYPGARERVTLTYQGLSGEPSRVSADIVMLPTAVTELPIGVLRVPAFYGKVEGAGNGRDTGSSQDVAELLQKLIAEGAKGIVLDLRGNGGGYLSESVETASLFLGSRTVAHLKNYEGKTQQEASKQTSSPYAGPLVILVDKSTASGAEIVTGALQAYGRAIIVGGKKTFGMGRVQNMIELKQISRSLLKAGKPTGFAKITTQKIYLPDGLSLQNRGIIPDVYVPSWLDGFVVSEADSADSPSTDKIQITREVSSERRKKADRVLDLSKRRQAELPEFKWLRAMLAFHQDAAAKDLSLNLDVRLRQKAAAIATWADLQTQGSLIYPLFEAKGVATFIAPLQGRGVSEVSSIKEIEKSSRERALPDVALREAFRVVGDLAREP